MAEQRASNSGAGGFWKPLAEIGLALLLIQAARAGLVVLIWRIWKPQMEADWAWVNIAVYLLCGLGVWLVLRPTARELGLPWREMPRGERTFYVAAGGSLLALVVTSLGFGTEILLQNAASMLVLPLFEETIFRGWAWNKLENSLKGKPAGLALYLGISVLFSLWHLGYMDVYMLKAMPANPGLEWGTFLAMKLLTTLMIGLVIGLARWRTKKLYAPLLVHGLINLFGR